MKPATRLTCGVFVMLVMVNAVQSSAAVIANGGSLKEINSPPPPSDDRRITIFGATLIDGRGGAPLSNSIVTIRGGKIAGVGQAWVGTRDENVFDATGLTLVPGLLDSHFHIERDYELPRLYLSHGVTSVRDPGQWISIYDPIRNSQQPQPRCFVAGPHLDAPPHAYPHDAFTITNQDQVRAAVNRFVDEGASHIKVYFRLPLDSIREACAAAHQRGVPVTAHLELVDADDAIRAGIDGVEHVTSFGTALAEKADAQKFRSAVRNENEARRKARYELWSKLDLDHSPRVKPLLDLLVTRKIFVSPTLAVFEKRAGDRGVSEVEAKGFANMLKFVRLCHRAGVTLVVGSHSSVPKAERGWAYQREMELLVECGLTPNEVIKTATLNTARFFHTDARLGSIEPGKLADLVLIEGDPSSDITAMRRVRAVMLNGKWVHTNEIFPAQHWLKKPPKRAGMSQDKLAEFSTLVSGRGCVVRNGAMIFEWGDQAKSSDVASAFKPLLTTLLMLGVQEGKLPDIDACVADAEPRLKSLNGGKDAAITWRHLASQTSGYGWSEKPGGAYAYNDYALALYYDTLMENVLGTNGTEVLRTRLAEPLQFEDRFTFNAFGEKNRPGRLALSCRDFARFGLLMLRHGKWRDRQIVRSEFVRTMISNPISPDMPLTQGIDSQMLPHQRTIGGTKNITSVGPGYYSFNWWLNTTNRAGERLFVDAPSDTFVASGHGGKRALVVIPSLDVIACWNDSNIDDHDKSPGNPNSKNNRALKLLVEACPR
jgi:imidazolonepropionase-like amidohydrolase